MTQVTAPQVRQARAQLGWSQRQLAQEANLAVSTIADFERGVRVPTAANLDAVKAAFDKAGVSFGCDGEISFAASRLSNQPLADGLVGSLITATDFDHWSGLTAQGLLPRLIGGLIRAGAGDALKQCDFPWHDSVQYSGPDGECEIDPTAATYPPEMLPFGRSLWELTTEKGEPFGKTRKASIDAAKRQNKKTREECAGITFVFVTTRRTQRKRRESWIRERKTLDGWRDVRVLDADRLAEWVNLFPAVAAWLAGMMGKPDAGCRRIEDVWHEWTETPKPPFNAAILLAGRDEAAVRVWTWLRTDSREPLFIQGETCEEVIAFLYAAFSELPDGTRGALLARSVVADTPDQARQIGNALIQHVIAFNEMDPDIAHRVARKGHRVIATYPAQTHFQISRAVVLPRAPRFDLHLLLEALFVGDYLDERRRKASHLSRQAGGSLGTLRDLMTEAFRKPNWVTALHVGTIRAAMLVGCWSANCGGDREIIGQLARKPYEEVERDLIEWTEKLGAPLRKVGDTWKIASPRHAYFWLAPGLTLADLDLFKRTAVCVLGENDPLIVLPPEKRFSVSFNGVRQKYSPLLKAGICDTLALLAVLPDCIKPAEPDAQSRVNAIVNQLLQGADRLRWLSLSSHLRTLAEAAPEAFLAAIEASLDKETTSQVLVLLESEPGPFGPSHRAELLWALEILAWDKKYFDRAAAILARLTLLDPNPDTRSANRPDASFTALFDILAPRSPLPWRFRFASLRELIATQPTLQDVFIRALFSVASRNSGFRVVGPFPDWRIFETDDPPDVRDWNSVPWSYISSAFAEASGLLVEMVSKRQDCWPRAIRAVADLPAEARSSFVVVLKSAAPGINDDQRRRELASALRGVIGHHRQFPDQDWALPETDLTALEEAHDLLQPHDPVLRHLWLFADEPITLLRPAPNDWWADHEEIERERGNAIAALWRNGGDQAIFELAASECVNLMLIGQAIARAAIPLESKGGFFRRSIVSADGREAAIATGILIGSSPNTGCRKKLLDDWLEVARVEQWPAGPVARLLLLRDSNPDTWNLATKWSEEVKRAYWSGQCLLAPGLSSAEVDAGLREMMAAGRAAHALHCGVRSLKTTISPALVSELLIAAALDDQATCKPLLAVYDVEDALGLLDRSDDFEDDKIAELEFKLLPYLEHSQRRGKLAIHRVMAKQPLLFRDLLCAVYPEESKSNNEADHNTPSEQEIRVATLCWGILRNWKTAPGLCNGIVDRSILEDWITQARAICNEADRLNVCDARIGNILAYTPVDPDDSIWPCRAVREVLPVFGSEEIEGGLVMGKINTRGVTVRDPREGGEKERTLQSIYAGWAKALRLKAPRAANVLERIARYYDADARREDDQAKRLEW